MLVAADVIIRDFAAMFDRYAAAIRRCQRVMLLYADDDAAA